MKQRDRKVLKITIPYFWDNEREMRIVEAGTFIRNYAGADGISITTGESLTVTESFVPMRRQPGNGLKLTTYNLVLRISKGEDFFNVFPDIER